MTNTRLTLEDGREKLFTGEDGELIQDFLRERDNAIISFRAQLEESKERGGVLREILAEAEKALFVVKHSLLPHDLDCTVDTTGCDCIVRKVRIAIADYYKFVTLQKAEKNTAPDSQIEYDRKFKGDWSLADNPDPATRAIKLAKELLPYIDGSSGGIWDSGKSAVFYTLRDALEKLDD